ncbi:MAG: prepilin-type N-terminal cleavage/methylation domain-containing protein [Candidatus Omnitrophica bacterium]|nr:prepilin-type N-terminal cleavage/methylation domain-containing protein [Candidatus Omnitrophota bacterium]MDD5488379.1 prepilin-type N-terminal cleavage/methylation domain-containing protein [Candidatus Omnitrophota bacterium]
MKMRKLMGKGGFTLVEIMIVVAIIGLLAAIAIPNFVKARETAQEKAALANLKQIEGAKTLWALDTGAATDATPAEADLVDDYLKVFPTGPSGITYTIGDMSTEPTATIPGRGTLNLDGTITAEEEEPPAEG